MVFHETSKEKARNVTRHGLLQGSGGDKRDTAIDKTDQLLNRLRPPELRLSKVDRQMNTYCYLSEDGKVIDITTGAKESSQDIVKDPAHTLLRIQIDPEACYVSDLDLYDQIKALVKDEDIPRAEILAHAYWHKLSRLSSYKGAVKRPEVMVTYDVPPEDIALA